MFSKCAGQILTTLCSLFKDFFIIFLKMYQSNIAQNELNTSKAYALKPFQYQKITPTTDSKVPYPRSGHRIGADSSNLYLFGGYNPWVRNDELYQISDEEGDLTSPLFQELWKFNFASKEWIKYPNSHTLPNELASSALVLHGNILMVIYLLNY